MIPTAPPVLPYCGKKRQTVCKPGSVFHPGSLQGGRTAIPLGAPLLARSSNQPGQLGAKTRPPKKGALSLFGLAPGGACHARPVAGTAVRSYRTFSPLPRKYEAVRSLWRFPSGRPGRTLSGALSSRSPDFPRRAKARRGRPTVWRCLFAVSKTCGQALSKLLKIGGIRNQ